MADPRSNGHGSKNSPNLGPLIIAAGIVLAGVVVAFAVLATRSSEPEPASYGTAPEYIPPPAQVPTDAVPSGEAPASPSAVGAQEALTATLTTAQAIRTESGNYSDATSFELATRLPAYTFLASSDPSTGPSEVSYYAQGNVFAAAALGDDGTCWWIKDDRTTSTTTYGAGPICTGNSALSAAAPGW